MSLFNHISPLMCAVAVACAWTCALAQQTSDGSSCAQTVTTAITGVVKIMKLDEGVTVSYVVETDERSPNASPMKDTIRIIRTGKALIVRSGSGVFLSSANMTVQTMNVTKRMIVSRPTKALESMASKAQAEALSKLLDLIAASASTACKHDDATGNLVVTTQVKETAAGRAKYKPITSAGSTGQNLRPQPISITSVVTEKGEFVSISCRYSKEAPIESLSVSNVTTRAANKQEIEEANAALAKMITKNGKPTGAFKRYSVIDLRKTNN